MQPPQVTSRLVVWWILVLTLCLAPLGRVPASNAAVGASAAPQTSGDQLTFAPDPLDFRKVVVGRSRTLVVTMTNRGSTSVTVSDVRMSAEGFSVTNLNLPLVLPVRGRAQFNVTFTPTSTGGASGNLAIRSDASNDTARLRMVGTGVVAWSLKANPPSLQFGNVSVGSRVMLPVALTNNGKSSVTVSQQSMTGSDFRFGGLRLPLTLGSGQSYTFNLSFAPQTGGPAVGAMRISSPLNPDLTISLAGTGTTAAQLAVTPLTVSFGNVTIETHASQTATLTATGSSVTVSSARTTNSVFQMSGLSLPVTLAAGDSLSFSLLFAPQTTGDTAATISFVSNATDSPTLATVSGTGTLPHTVTLSWNPSTSAVAGYEIYRSSNPHGPYVQVNARLNRSTSYSDGTVVSGQTYYYATTAVAPGGIQSGFSNRVKVVVP